VFEKMYESTQGTILIISHQERILNIADQILVVAGGEIRTVGKKDDVLPGLLNGEGSACQTLLGKLS
jgi:Fe-S cluster assembly ATP-binding protein